MYPAQRKSGPPSLLTLILLTAISTMSLNMFLPSLANIASDLDTSYAVASFAVGGYLAVTALVQLVIGTLSDHVGRRPVLILALCTFTVASLICAIATNIWVFLLFRMFQGAIITGYTLSLAVVRDTNTQRETVSLLGYISMAMAIAPMLAPVLGGVLDSTLGWRSNFYFFALSGALLCILCWIDFGETKISRPNSNNAGLASGLKILRVPAFWAFSMCSAFATGAFYIFLTGAPLFAQMEFGITTAELGIYIGSITAGFMTGSFVAGRLAPKLDPLVLMVTGRAIACFGLCAGIFFVLYENITPLIFFGSTLFVGIGNGVTMPASNTAALSVDSELTGSAAGLSGALVVSIGAILTTITGWIMSNNHSMLMLFGLMLAASLASLAAIMISFAYPGSKNKGADS